MSAQRKILVVDDNPQNMKLLADMLMVEGYAVVTAAAGLEALEKVEADRPDLILLDVMMPGMNGYEVCRRIRENAAYGILPVVMVTALDPSEERINGLEAGADDFLTKPINDAELLARVRSLLRIKELYDTVEAQAAELKQWAGTLETRVAEQLEQLDKVGRLKRFLSPALVEMIVDGGTDDPMQAHRREVTVVFVDLRGFTSFAETAEPEEVMGVLHDYHAKMGGLIMEYEGTIEQFAGDGIMVIFNDPVPAPDHTERAVRMSAAMRRRIEELKLAWQKRGYDLDCGIGIARGYATIGAVGFEGRWDYATIGTVANLAARLCTEAKGGQILMSHKALGAVEDLVETEPLNPLALKGFSNPVTAYNVVAVKQ